MDTEESNTRIARPGQRSGARLYGALAGLMITTFLVALDVTIIATAIPSILSAFRTTGDIGWYGAAYSLTLCSLQPVIGKCASLFPPRTVYQLSLAIFLLGSLICATATSRIMFLAARGVAGAGAAGLSTGGLSIIAAMAPVDKRPMFTSLVLSLYAIRTVIAPVLGGVLTEKVSWRWCCVHPLKGIFHMAMSLKDKSFSQMTHNEWHTALEAKVTGTWNLHHVLRQVEEYELLQAIHLSLTQQSDAAPMSRMTIGLSPVDGPHRPTVLCDRDIRMRLLLSKGTEKRVNASDSSEIPTLLRKACEDPEFLGTPAAIGIVHQEIVRKLNSFSTGGDSIGLQQPFHQVGLDSLVMTEMRIWIQRAFHIEMGIPEILGARHIDGLSQIVLQKLEAKCKTV